MANGRTKVTTDQVAQFITNEKKTIKDVASKFAVTPATARKHLLSLVGTGAAKKEGTKPLPDGTRGRNPDMYTYVGANAGTATTQNVNA